METINNIELRDEDRYPDEAVLRSVLGPAYDAYLALLELFGKHGMHHEWRYYHDGKAWLCKVQKKKRTIVWMSAWKGYMQATVYFPLRLLEAVLALELSKETKEKIINTKNVGRSKPCIFELRTEEVLTELERVVEWKISSK